MSVMDSVKSLLGADPAERAAADMREVLDALKSLNPKPIESLDAVQARRQPSAADAALKVAHEKGLQDVSAAGVTSTDIQFPGAAGQLPARVYRPASHMQQAQRAAGAAATPARTPALPVILYFHGGGFVIADLDTYDAAPRALANRTGAIVVSAHYRQAPEYPFPAAHEDAFAAWRWITDNAASLGGDPGQVSVMGESAGANLAANVAIYARDHGLTPPRVQGLVYPIADTNTMTLSYEENRSAKPLNKDMMLWFVKQSLTDDAEKKDLRLRLVDQDLHDLPPAVVITAGIDPLRSDGEHLAKALASAGVPVTLKNFPGATHEFFGMGAVVQDARDAQALVSDHLRRYGQAA